MTHKSIPRARCAVFLAAAIALLSAGSLSAARADEGGPSDEGGPPPAVARISVADGTVGVKHGDSDQVAAAINAPVEAGDYITTGNDGRVEVQLDPRNVVRAGADTQIRFTQLDGATDTVQLAQGTVELRVLQADDDHPTVQTPSADVVPDEAGAYLITVDSNGMTQVTSRTGSLDVNTPQGSQTLDPGRTMDISGNANNPQYQFVDEVASTDFESWANDRDQQLLADANAYQNVNGDVIGAPDLDQYGTWQNVSGVGECWQPNDQPAGWAPYTAGAWAYENYYGWTWVSSEPWGWAPYHYGRWAFVGSSWYWVPGPRYAAPVYSPALVAFVGIGAVRVGVGLGSGNVGWVPLAPGEAPHPWWGVGRSLTVNNVTVINNYRNASHGIASVPISGWQHGDFTHINRLSPMQVRDSRVAGERLPQPTAANYRFTSRNVGMSEPKPQYQRFESIHPIGTAQTVWRNASTPAQHAAAPAIERAAPTSSWQHFGAQRSAQSATARNSYSGSGGWQHFGRQSYQRAQGYNSYYSRPQQTYQRQTYQRSYQQQSYQRPQGYSSYYARPQQRYQQTYQRPYQQPSYQRPYNSYSSRPQSSFQRPTYQAPRQSSPSRGSDRPHGHPM